MNKSEKFWAYAALVSVCIFWGTTYFGIRIAVHDFPPFFLSGTRHFLAGCIFIFYFMGIKKYKLPPFNELAKMFILGCFLILGSNVFLSFAEQSIPSGLASLICAFLPFYLLIINRLMGTSESFSKLSFLGLLVGIFGMGVIFYDSIFDILNGKYTLGIILTLLANLTWAFGTIYARKSNFKTNPLFSSGLQMIMMGIFISLISFLNGDFEVVKFSQPSVLAFFYLVVFGSIVGFGSFTYANAKLPTSVTSIYAYVNPVVAVLLGTLFLDEKITYFTVSGMFLTLIGVFLVNKGNS